MPYWGLPQSELFGRYDNKCTHFTQRMTIKSNNILYSLILRVYPTVVMCEIGVYAYVSGTSPVFSELVPRGEQRVRYAPNFFPLGSYS